MGWQPRPRWDDRRKRYTCTIRGEHKYLGRTYPAALKRMAELLEVPLEQLPAEPSPLLVAELVEARRRHCSSKWEQTLLRSWATDDGPMPLEDVSSDSLAVFAGKLEARGLSPQTVHHHVNSALKAMTWAVSRGWLESAPRKPRLPRPLRRPRDQRLESVSKAVAKLEHAGPVVKFILATGCRPGEACRLEWSDVDLEAGVAELRAHKTARRTGALRQIFLTPAARAVLESIPRAANAVFVNRTGDPYTPAGLRSMLYKAGLRGGAYSLRHTAAQGWLEAGVPLEDVAGLLGHRDMRTVGVYAQVRADRLRRVASAIQAAPLPPVLETREQLSTAEPAPGPSPRRASKPKPKPGPRKAS